MENFFDNNINAAATDSVKPEATVEAFNAVDEFNEEVVRATPDESVDLKEGALPDEVRKSLVLLLKRGVLLASNKPGDFAVISQHQELVRRYLDNLYLRIMLDEREGLVFVAAIEEDEDEHVSLINKRTLSVYDTLVLLILRKHYQEREASGEQKIIIDVDSVTSKMVPFLPLTNSDTADHKKLMASLNKMSERQVIISVRGSGDRYEITPVIRHIASATVLEKMLSDYLLLAKEGGAIERVDTLTEQEEQEQQHELTLKQQGEA